MDEKLFSIFYLNLDKVYELKMITDNVVPISRTSEHQGSKKKSSTVSGSVGVSAHVPIKAQIGAEINSETLDSTKVLDSFSIKTTKSNILNCVLRMVFKPKHIVDIKIGRLVKIDNMRLIFANETLLRTFKMFSQNVIKYSTSNEVDINKLINAFSKDYAYLLTGTSTEFGEIKFVIKIPFAVNNEFESSYSVEDLLISDVSIIGVYRGGIKGKELIRNSFNFFQSIGKLSEIPMNTGDEVLICSSTYEGKQQVATLSENIEEDEIYHYIDLFAIIQDIEIDGALKSDKQTKEKGSSSKGFFNWLKRFKK